MSNDVWFVTVDGVGGKLFAPNAEVAERGIAF
jgi:hypothetical protein